MLRFTAVTDLAGEVASLFDVEELKCRSSVFFGNHPDGVPGVHDDIVSDFRLGNHDQIDITGDVPRVDLGGDRAAESAVVDPDDTSRDSDAHRLRLEPNRDECNSQGIGGGEVMRFLNFERRPMSP